MFRVIIAGTRDFNDYDLLSKHADQMLSNVADEIEIVSGGAKGADALGERYALQKGYNVKRFPADWAKYGRRAGPMRNAEMAKYADALIAYWDGKSKGTKSMIDLATKEGLKVRVKIYGQEE